MAVKTEPKKFPFGILWKYPHMLPADVALWERFIRLEHPMPCTVAYDVHVGSLPPLPADLPEYLQRDAQALYPCKIDAVMYSPQETLIVEVKPRASTYAIGQVLSYTNLFHRDFPEHPRPTPCIITDTAHQDTPWLCEILNIILVELDHLEEQSK